MTPLMVEISEVMLLLAGSGNFLWVNLQVLSWLPGQLTMHFATYRMGAIPQSQSKSRFPNTLDPMETMLGPAENDVTSGKTQY